VRRVEAFADGPDGDGGGGPGARALVLGERFSAYG
jgi:hypothetical protein